MIRQVSFTIPAEFIWPRVRLTFPEISCGYRQGWLNEEGAIAICSMQVAAGATQPAMEEIAHLLLDEKGRVADILNGLRVDCDTTDLKELWLYLALAWLYENRNDGGDPLAIVEMIYSDFDYPDELEGFVRYMPLPPGAKPGEAGMLSRWEAYLVEQEAKYQGRH